jgi:hypothetical protein
MVTELYEFLYSEFFVSELYTLPDILNNIADEICAIGSIVIIGFMIGVVLMLFKYFFRYIISLGGKK